MLIKQRFSVLFIDRETVYLCTIKHVLKIQELYRNVTDTFSWEDSSVDDGKQCFMESLIFFLLAFKNHLMIKDWDIKSKRLSPDKDCCVTYTIVMIKC